MRAGATATAIIGYASTGAGIELPANQFDDYLRLYGLENIVKSRAGRGEQAKPGRERFFRYAKTLLTGQEPSQEVSRPLGLRYEIVPDVDPTRHGKPLASALIVALLKGKPTHLSARSDAQGGFTLGLSQGGVWLIKSVHMVRASFFSSEDWDSLWASLTFEVREPKP